MYKNIRNYLFLCELILNFIIVYLCTILLSSLWCTPFCLAQTLEITICIIPLVTWEVVAFKCSVQFSSVAVSSFHYNDVIMITRLTIVFSALLFRRRSKKTSKLRVTSLCVGNSPGTGEFPAQMTSNAENVFIWWRHHVC